MSATNDLISDVGREVTLRRVTQGGYDVTTGSISKTTLDETVNALVLSYKDNQFANSQIQQGDRKIVISADDVNQPDLDDLVIVGSATFRIVDVQVVEEDTISMIYTCQVRAE